MNSIYKSEKEAIPSLDSLELRNKAEVLSLKQNWMLLPTPRKYMTAGLKIVALPSKGSFGQAYLCICGISLQQ